MGRGSGSSALRRALLFLTAAGVLAVTLCGSASVSQAADGPEIDLSKSASTATAVAGQDFVWYLSYSCASLTVSCTNATVTDTLPSEVSRAAADVDFSGNFADVAYNPSTGTARFTLFTPLPPGAAAQIVITVHFPAATAAGTAATNQATMTADGAVPASSNAVTVTATTAPWVVTKKGVTSVAQLDTPYTYEVSIRLAAGGTKSVSNARLVDSLPPGAQFGSATQGGVHDLNTGTVTWALGTLVPSPTNDVTTSRQVTVTFPSATGYQAGDQPVNFVEGFGTPAGLTDQSLGTALAAAVLRAAGDLTGASKTDTRDSLSKGQSDTFTITGSNPNAGPFDEMAIVENLPSELSMVQNGIPNLTGAGTAPAVSWRPLGGGAFQAIATAPSGGGWGATIPATADEITLAYGAVASGAARTALVRAGVRADGKDRAGITVPIGSDIRNCISVTASTAGTAAVGRSSCTDQTLAPAPK